MTDERPKLAPNQTKFLDLISDIETGVIKIPDFQRELVWSIEDAKQFLDSIYRGYPIGSFIFWETQEHLKTVRNIGNLSLPETPPGFAKYVLDGQQRITSIYASLREAFIQSKRYPKGRKYEILFDLDSRQFAVEADLKDDVDQTRYVSIAKILDVENHLTVFSSLKTAERRKAFNEVYNAFITYPFPYVTVGGQSIGVVCEIFERMNTTGVPLSVVDLKVAQTWGTDFDLRKQLNAFEQKLLTHGFSTIPEIVVLQAISTLLTDRCSREAILEFDRRSLVTGWEDYVRALEQAIDFFRNTMRIKLSRILPFGVVLVPVAYFYFKNHYQEPTKEQARHLSRWFWKACIANRYDSGLDTKIFDDAQQIVKLLAGTPPEFEYPVRFEEQDIVEQKYSLRNAFCLTILCLFSQREPRDLRNNSRLDLTQNFSKYNSREMHHIFPRKVAREMGKADLADSVANICFIPASLNKDISDKKPSEYIEILSKSNPELDATLASHFITEDSRKYLDFDKFEPFLRCRAHDIKLELDSLVSDS